MVSCTDTLPEPEPSQDFELVVPVGFPDIVFPDDNTFTKDRWLLGKKLFYDPIMSADSTVSCNSCHKQAFAFGDFVPTSPGIKDRPGVRNAPVLTNLAYAPYFTSEGGVPSLEMQALVPIQEHNEFDFNILLVQERLNKIPAYLEMSKKAYDRTPDYYVITRALANFERSLLSGNSAFDYYKYQGKPEAISEEAKKGYALFSSNRTQCSSCHSGPNFTNYAFENNGLYKNYLDEGRKRLTGKETDQARFKVPTLRNIELSAPYMHDGSMQSLEEVVEHYQTGGSQHANKSALVQPLNLSEVEKRQLVAFLLSLTDQNFIENKHFEKP